MPKPAILLLFIKMLLVIPCGTVLSTLVLYLTKHLHFTDTNAMQMIASFIACGGIARVLGGYVGDRYISFRGLLCLSALTLCIGCLFIVSVKTFYLGITLATIGSGLTIAVNCLLTELIPTDDQQRQTAFLWQYSGMNAGYLISLCLSGYFELSSHYTLLFIISSSFALLALIIIFLNYSTLKFINTKNVAKTERSLFGYILLMVFFIGLYYLIKQSIMMPMIVLSCWLIITGSIIYYGTKEPSHAIKSNLYTYFKLTIPVLLFWSIYHLTPMATTLFIERNVDRHVLNFAISPQWIQLISTFTIIIGGPALSLLFNQFKKYRIQISTSTQFSVALVLAGLSLSVLAIGIRYSNTHDQIQFNWVILSFIFQGMAEILIAPIGFAIIGRYAPPALRGIMMGNWMMLISIGAIISSNISTIMFHQLIDPTPKISNEYYQAYFQTLGYSTVMIGIISLCLIFLKRNRFINFLRN